MTEEATGHLTDEQLRRARVSTEMADALDVVLDARAGGPVTDWQEERRDLQALALADIAESLRVIATALDSLDHKGIEVHTWPA